MRKKTWQKAEDACCKQTGAKLTPRSGAGFVYKGDCILKNEDGKIMYEVKSSSRSDSKGAFIVLNSSWFATLKKNALALGVDFCVYLYFADTTKTFAFIYDPFVENTSNYMLVGKTRKVYLSELESRIPGLVVDNEPWKEYTDV